MCLSGVATPPTPPFLGGRIQVLVRSPDGTYQGYNGMTEVPAGYAAPKKPVSQGYGAIATPGVVAGLSRLHSEHGSLRWPVLLQEPARIAADGFALLPGAAARHETGLELFREDPGFQQTFIKDDGSTYDAGDILKQPVLADTITRLAEAGADDFYNGKIARQIAADMAANGGYVTTEERISPHTRFSMGVASRPITAVSMSTPLRHPLAVASS
jgi:gamma-glutamyltranspeptidase/glutathione hydrolase